MSQATPKAVTIRYGDGYIDVVNRLHVSKRADGEFKVDLDPQKKSESGADYVNRDVHLIGKDANASWLNGTFNASSVESNTISITDQETGDYDYTVRVQDHGEIDPRIVVVP